MRVKIAVLADTHVGDRREKLNERILEAIKGVDLIFHAGDIVQPETLEELARLAPIEAVAGNHDCQRFGLDLPRRKIVEVAGYRFGLIHGDEYWGVHMNKSQQLEYLYQLAVEPFLEAEPLDMIIFGHSHRPILDSCKAVFRPPGPMGRKEKRTVLLFSPGMGHRNRYLSSIGFLYLQPTELRAEIMVFGVPKEKKGPVIE